MRATFKDMSIDFKTRKQVVSFIVDGDVSEELDKLKDKPLALDVKVYREKRSRNANNYMWQLAEKIAVECGTTKEEIYRENVRQVGVFRDFESLDAGAAKTLETAWGRLGTGWLTEQVDYSPDGERVTVRCYYGSSQYNTKQMSRLIDKMVQDATSLGIVVDVEEARLLAEEWGR